MKISGVEVRQIEVPYGPDGYRPTWLPNVKQHTFPQTVVRVFSDSGLVGAASTNCFGKEVYEFIRIVAPLLLGRSLEGRQDLQEAWNQVRDRSRKDAGSRLLSIVMKEALSGNPGRDVEWFSVLSEFIGQFTSLKLLSTKNILLDNRPWVLNCALWDLLGKEREKPVCDLLGRERDKIKAYVSTGELVDETSPDFAMRCRDEGFEMIKLRAHRYPNYEEDLTHIESVRKRVGDDMKIGVDANQAWTVLPPYWDREVAMDVARELDDMEVAWLEEPLGGLDLEGINQLSEAVDMPIVGGELEHGFEHFQELIQAYDIINPDIVMSVGISEGMEIAQEAANNQTNFTPHTWDLGPGVAAGLQVACSIENCYKLEYPYDPSWPIEYRDSILAEPIQAEEGYLSVPDRPGLGMELDMDTVDEYTQDRFVLGPEPKVSDSG